MVLSDDRAGWWHWRGYRNWAQRDHSTYSHREGAAIHLVLPPCYSKRILYASTLITASVCSALYNRRLDNALLATLVLASSINYWRHPVIGHRRSLDMLCASASLLYQLIWTCNLVSRAARCAYYTTVCMGCACYVSARVFAFTRRDYNLSSTMHVCLHLWANAGNLILYDALGANLLGLTAQ